MQEYLKLLRVQSWVKNLLLLIPAVFSFNLFNPNIYLPLFAAILSFSIMSSTVYIINDRIDMDKDRLHPRKKLRPLASGKISPNKALILAVFLFIISVFIGLFFLPSSFLIVLSAYLSLNVFYVLQLKHIPVLDAFCIASGFVLRVLAGCYAIEVLPSDWIIVVTFFLALFLAFSKRRSELRMLDEQAVLHREVLKGYTLKMLDVFIYLSAGICITSYIIYTITNTSIPEHLHQPLKYSSFLVTFGVFRYIQVTEQNKNIDADPTVMLYSDRYLQATVIIWFVYVTATLYANS